MVSLFGLLTLALAAQEVDYDQDQYNAYMAAMKAAEEASSAAAQADALLDYAKANPELSLVKYVYGKYTELMRGYHSAGKHQDVVTMGTKLLEHQPDDLNALLFTADSAFRVQDFEKAAKYGEQIPEQNRTPGLVYLLAISNQKSNNTEAFVRYGEMVLANLEAKDYLPGHLDIATGIRGYYVGKNSNKVTEYSRKLIAALNEAATPQGISDSDWRKYTRGELAVSYVLLGQGAVQNQNWSEAVANYSKALNYTGDRDIRSEALYHIGMGRFRQNRYDSAMEAFAQGAVLRGASNAQACRGQLEYLYKLTHNGSTAGIEEYIARVTGG